MILAPVALPEITSESKLPPNLFFSFGEQDDLENRTRMESFAGKACGRLIRTQILYLRTGHVAFDIDEIKRKHKAIAAFVLSDY